MDTTVLLAQMWGPAILAVGLGIFVSRKYYIRIYRELEKETLAVLLFGMAGIAAGLAQIQFHNRWDTFTEGLISFLGWALLIKGLIFAIAPRAVDQGGDWMVSSKLIASAGYLAIILGGYLSWVGFFG